MMNKKQLKKIIQEVILENKENSVLLHERKIFEKAGAEYLNSINVFDVDPDQLSSAKTTGQVISPDKMAEVAFNTMLAIDFFKNEGAITENIANLQYDISKGSSPNLPIVQRFRESLYSGKRSPFLTYYEVEDLAKMDLYILKGYNAGFAIKDGDDIVAVHNNTGGELSKLSSKFMPDAIKAGGTKLDHFDGFLSGNYRKYGFQTLTQIYDWNGEYKPEGWFYPMTNVFDENTSVYAKAFKQLYNSNPAELPTEEVTISVESGFQRTCVPVDKWVMYRRGMPDVIFRKL